MTLEEERDDLRKELRAVQEMLAQVLHAVGQPISVNKEDMGNLPDGTQIMIDDDLQGERFVFSLKEPE